MKKFYVLDFEDGGKTRKGEKMKFFKVKKEFDGMRTFKLNGYDKVQPAGELVADELLTQKELDELRKAGTVHPVFRFNENAVDPVNVKRGKYYYFFGVRFEM